MSETEIAAFTRAGCELAGKLAEKLPDARAWAPRRLAGDVGLPGFDGVGAWTSARLEEGCRQLVFVGACGIAVRAIAPHVASKLADPAVVCVDEAGTWAISLLSGHIGGANDLAHQVAGAIGAQAVVSTATDVRGVLAIDEWAARQGLAIANPGLVKLVSGTLLDGGSVAVEAGRGVTLAGTLPKGFVRKTDKGDAGGADTRAGDPLPRVHIGPEAPAKDEARTLHLLTRTVVVGAGCRRGCDPRTLQASIEGALARAGLSIEAVGTLATIDIKADEPAMIELARAHGWQLRTFDAATLAAQAGDFASSEFVRAHVGVDNVCERALACCGAKRTMGKTALEGTTVALGCMPLTLRLEGKETLDA